MAEKIKLVGPFQQLLTMDKLPSKGAIQDDQLEVIYDSAICIEGEKVLEVGNYFYLEEKYQRREIEIEYIEEEMVVMPGLIDSHTHLSYGGDRTKDYAARNSGKSYLEIAKSGGGIWSSVLATRKASREELMERCWNHLDEHMNRGVTTVEVKSGYGLDVESELKMLQVINQCGEKHSIDLIPTCLAAHMIPKEYNKEDEYLGMLLQKILPEVKKQKLSNRVDIFTEETAFSIEGSRNYLEKAKEMGFQLTIHADQFSVGGSKVAVEAGALSADHLEASSEKEILLLGQSDTVATVLPGASIGLGMHFAPARKLLDAGACLAIASDWNPGSAPQGNLLMQAAILGAYEKLSAAEVLSGITFRAAKALDLKYYGKIRQDFVADFIAFPTKSFHEILYRQGELMPTRIWKKGKECI